MALSDRSTWRWNMSGWIVFIVSAVFFMIDAVRNGSIVATVASTMFLVGCALFIRPVWSTRPSSHRHDPEPDRP